MSKELSRRGPERPVNRSRRPAGRSQPTTAAARVSHGCWRHSLCASSAYDDVTASEAAAGGRPSTQIVTQLRHGNTVSPPTHHSVRRSRPPGRISALQAGGRRTRHDLCPAVSAAPPGSSFRKIPGPPPRAGSEHRAARHTGGARPHPWEVPKSLWPSGAGVAQSFLRASAAPRAVKRGQSVTRQNTLDTTAQSPEGGTMRPGRLRTRQFLVRRRQPCVTSTFARVAARTICCHYSA